MPPSRARLIRVVSVLLIAGVMLAGALETAVRIGKIRNGQPRTGDFVHFYEAAAAMARGGDIYASGSGGYIYPPFIAWLFQPLTPLGHQGAAWAWLAINTVTLLACIWLLSAEMVRRFGLTLGGAVRPLPAPADAAAARARALRDGAVTATLAVAAIATLALADKIRSLLTLGQTDCLMILAFALGLRWLDRRPLLAGLLLGAAANIKYLPLLLLPWLLLRRRFRTSAAMVVASVAVLFAPALSVGWERNLQYVHVATRGLQEMAGLAPRAAAPTPTAAPALAPPAPADASATSAPARGANIFPIDWIRSVSFTSAATRVLGEKELNAKVAGVVGVLALACFALGWSMYTRAGVPLLARARLLANKPPAGTPPAPRDLRLDALEWSAFIAAILLFSPQTTSRHMAMFLPLAALAGALVLHHRGTRTGRVVIAALALFLAGLVLPPGGGAFEGAVQAWRFVGGASWTTAALLFACVWATLRAVATDQHAVAPDPHAAAKT